MDEIQPVSEILAALAPQRHSQNGSRPLRTTDFHPRYMADNDPPEPARIVEPPERDNAAIVNLKV